MSKTTATGNLGSFIVGIHWSLDRDTIPSASIVSARQACIRRAETFDVRPGRGRPDDVRKKIVSLPYDSSDYARSRLGTRILLPAQMPDPLPRGDGE